METRVICAVHPAPAPAPAPPNRSSEIDAVEVDSDTTSITPWHEVSMKEGASSEHVEKYSPPLVLPSPPLRRNVQQRQHTQVLMPQNDADDSNATFDSAQSLRSPPPKYLSPVPIIEASKERHLTRIDIGESSTDDDLTIDRGLLASVRADQRNSISMRSQAYASMAVVAALIAGISVTFIVEIDFEPTKENREHNDLLAQACVIGALAVCFLSLYGTTVLSMQYYLVTRALGHVTSTDIDAEGCVLNEVMEFMRKTRRVRHLAVKCVVLSIPLFTCVVALYGVAKAGLGAVGFAAVGLSITAMAFFLHAIVSQQMAFVFDGANESGNLSCVNSDVSETQSDTPSKELHTNDVREAARQIMKKTTANVSNFRLVW